MDALFAKAVSLVDAGDAAALARLLDEHPHLARERTEFEEHAYFQRPYLLWFVAENPVRNGRLPPNIAEVAKLILDRAQDPAQLDYALALVASGRVPREVGVQRALIDVLCDAGASPDQAVLSAIAHQELEALEHLLARGAAFTPTVAAALGREVPLDDADAREKQLALTAAAFYGNARAVELLVSAGADVRAFSPEGLHPHATPLHQAVFADSLDCVRTLVDAGARLDVEDRAHHSTPLGWAEYLGRPEIASYLREHDR